jgi:hypothetical protein
MIAELSELRTTRSSIETGGRSDGSGGMTAEIVADFFHLLGQVDSMLDSVLDAQHYAGPTETQVHNSSIFHITVPFSRKFHVPFPWTPWIFLFHVLQEATGMQAMTS